MPRKPVPQGCPHGHALDASGVAPSRGCTAMRCNTIAGIAPLRPVVGSTMWAGWRLGEATRVRPRVLLWVCYGNPGGSDEAAQLTPAEARAFARKLVHWANRTARDGARCRAARRRRP